MVLWNSVLQQHPVVSVGTRRPSPTCHFFRPERKSAKVLRAYGLHLSQTTLGNPSETLLVHYVSFRQH